MKKRVYLKIEEEDDNLKDINMENCFLFIVISRTRRMKVKKNRKKDYYINVLLNRSF